MNCISNGKKCHVISVLIWSDTPGSHPICGSGASWMSDHSLCRIERCVLLSHSLSVEGALGLYRGGFDIVLCACVALWWGRRVLFWLVWLGPWWLDPLVIRVMDSFFGISYLAVTLHSELCNLVTYVMKFGFDCCGEKKDTPGNIHFCQACGRCIPFFDLDSWFLCLCYEMAQFNQ